MKLNDLALIIILFIITSFILSLFDVISFAFTDILAYSLLVIGIALVYTETIRQNKLSIFLGTVIFLFGVYFLITEKYNLNPTGEYYLPILLIYCGSGLVMLYILTSAKIIYMISSLILISTGLVIIALNSHLAMRSFFHSILPVLQFLWPVLIIFLILIFMMRVR